MEAIGLVLRVETGDKRNAPGANPFKRPMLGQWCAMPWLWPSRERTIIHLSARGLGSDNRLQSGMALG